jgi:hypothetical protein
MSALTSTTALKQASPYIPDLKAKTGTLVVSNSANNFSTPGILVAIPSTGINKNEVKFENVDLEKAQSVISRETDPAVVYQGRKWSIWPSSRAQQYFFCGLSIPLCGLVLGILGAVYYAQNKDASSDDSHGQYLKRLGVIFLSIGWPVACCCGGAIGIGWSKYD